MDNHGSRPPAITILEPGRGLHPPRHAGCGIVGSRHRSRGTRRAEPRPATWTSCHRRLRSTRRGGDAPARRPGDLAPGAGPRHPRAGPHLYRDEVRPLTTGPVDRQPDGGHAPSVGRLVRLRVMRQTTDEVHRVHAHSSARTHRELSPRPADCDESDRDGRVAHAAPCSSGCSRGSPQRREGRSVRWIVVDACALRMTAESSIE